jgi:hypothetical protein
MAASGAVPVAADRFAGETSGEQLRRIVLG